MRSTHALPSTGTRGGLVASRRGVRPQLLHVQGGHRPVASPSGEGVAHRARARASLPSRTRLAGPGLGFVPRAIPLGPQRAAYLSAASAPWFALQRSQADVRHAVRAGAAFGIQDSNEPDAHGPSRPLSASRIPRAIILSFFETSRSKSSIYTASEKNRRTSRNTQTGSCRRYLCHRTSRLRLM